MLEIRPTCEHCTFECTYCKDCVNHILNQVCPNCGGGFEKRLIRPKTLLKKYPVSIKIIYKPVDIRAHLKK